MYRVLWNILQCDPAKPDKSVNSELFKHILNFRIVFIKVFHDNLMVPSLIHFLTLQPKRPKPYNNLELLFEIWYQCFIFCSHEAFNSQAIVVDVYFTTKVSLLCFCNSGHPGIMKFFEMTFQKASNRLTKSKKSTWFLLKKSL